MLNTELQTVAEKAGKMFSLYVIRVGLGNEVFGRRSSFVVSFVLSDQLLKSCNVNRFFLISAPNKEES